MQEKYDRWTQAETFHLITLWEKNFIDLRGQSYKKPIYTRIASELQRLTLRPAPRTSKEIKVKMTSLTGQYNKYFAQYGASQSPCPWHFYYKLHRFLSTRPVIDLSRKDQTSSSGGEQESDASASLLRAISSNVRAACNSNNDDLDEDTTLYDYEIPITTIYEPDSSPNHLQPPGRDEPQTPVSTSSAAHKRKRSEIDSNLEDLLLQRKELEMQRLSFEHQINMKEMDIHSKIHLEKIKMESGNKIRNAEKFSEQPQSMAQDNNRSSPEPPPHLQPTTSGIKRNGEMPLISPSSRENDPPRDFATSDDENTLTKSQEDSEPDESVNTSSLQRPKLRPHSDALVGFALEELSKFKRLFSCNVPEAKEHDQFGLTIAEELRELQNPLYVSMAKLKIREAIHKIQKMALSKLEQDHKFALKDSTTTDPLAIESLKKDPTSGFSDPQNSTDSTINSYQKNPLFLRTDSEDCPLGNMLLKLEKPEEGEGDNSYYVAEPPTKLPKVNCTPPPSVNQNPDSAICQQSSSAQMNQFHHVINPTAFKMNSVSSSSDTSNSLPLNLVRLKTPASDQTRTKPIVTIGYSTASTTTTSNTMNSLSTNTTMS